MAPILQDDDTGGDKISDLDRLHLTLDSLHVARFHATPRVKPQSLGLHVSGVALIATYIYGGVHNVTGKFILACLTHDQEELLSGDIPFTAKRDFPALQRVVQQMEAAYNQAFLVRGLELTEAEHLILKAADMLEGMFYTSTYEHGDRVFLNWRRSMEQLTTSQLFQHLLAPAEQQRILEMFNSFNKPE